MSILSSLDALGCVTIGGPNTIGVSLVAGGGGIARGASLKSKGSVPINEQMYIGDSICANNTTQTPLNR